MWATVSEASREKRVRRVDIVLGGAGDPEPIREDEPQLSVCGCASLTARLRGEVLWGDPGAIGGARAKGTIVGVGSEMENTGAACVEQEIERVEELKLFASCAGMERGGRAEGTCGGTGEISTHDVRGSERMSVRSS